MAAAICGYSTLGLFGVGWRTAGHGPGAAAGVPARPRQQTEVSPPPPMVRRRPIRSLDDVAATERRTTSRVPHGGAQLGTSGRFPHPANYFQWINSTSGLGLAPQSKPWSMAAYEIQWFRHSAVVFSHFPGISHFPSPKWRLKLLPVPVMTWNFESSHPVSY